jgi:hypothetical protein
MPRPRKPFKRKTRISSKGALIKGMSKILPREILENPVFKKKMGEVMKGYAGIYALYNNETLYYVGLTRNLYGRINWHFIDRHKGKWNRFIIFRIKKVNYLKDIETLVIRIFNIKGNRAKGHVPKDADIGRVLRETLRQHKKEIRGIEKALR